jgi:hypothetical protein
MAHIKVRDTIKEVVMVAINVVVLKLGLGSGIAN